MATTATFIKFLIRFGFSIFKILKGPYFVEVTVCPELPKNIFTSTTTMLIGGFGVIFMPKKISTSTTLDFLEIYVTLLKFCEIFEMLYPVLYFVKFLTPATSDNLATLSSRDPSGL